MEALFGRNPADEEELEFAVWRWPIGRGETRDVHAGADRAAPLGILGESVAYFVRDILPVAQDAVHMSQAALHHVAVQLREPFTGHAQDDSAARIEQPDQRHELRYVGNVYQIAAAPRQVHGDLHAVGQVVKGAAEHRASDWRRGPETFHETLENLVHSPRNAAVGDAVVNFRGLVEPLATCIYGDMMFGRDSAGDFIRPYADGVLHRRQNPIQRLRNKSNSHGFSPRNIGHLGRPEFRAQAHTTHEVPLSRITGC